MSRLFWVCLGSAVGGGARYLVALAAARVLGGTFPAGTLAVNVLGSFLVAALVSAGVHAAALPPIVLLALTTGVLGGFTTYSTFSLETVRYLQDGAWGVALGYVAATVVGGIGAGLLGWAAGRAWAG